MPPPPPVVPKKKKAAPPVYPITRPRVVPGDAHITTISGNQPQARYDGYYDAATNAIQGYNRTTHALRVDNGPALYGVSQKLNTPNTIFAAVGVQFPGLQILEYVVPDHSEQHAIGLAQALAIPLVNNLDTLRLVFGGWRADAATAVPQGILDPLTQQDHMHEIALVGDAITPMLRHSNVPALLTWLENVWLGRILLQLDMSWPRAFEFVRAILENPHIAAAEIQLDNLTVSQLAMFKDANIAPWCHRHLILGRNPVGDYVTDKLFRDPQDEWAFPGPRDGFGDRNFMFHAATGGPPGLYLVRYPDSVAGSPDALLAYPRCWGMDPEINAVIQRIYRILVEHNGADAKLPADLGHWLWMVRPNDWHMNGGEWRSPLRAQLSAYAGTLDHPDLSQDVRRAIAQAAHALTMNKDWPKDDDKWFLSRRFCHGLQAYLAILAVLCEGLDNELVEILSRRDASRAVAAASLRNLGVRKLAPDEDASVVRVRCADDEVHSLLRVAAKSSSVLASQMDAPGFDDALDVLDAGQAEFDDLEAVLMRRIDAKSPADTAFGRIYRLAIVANYMGVNDWNLLAPIYYYLVRCLLGRPLPKVIVRNESSKAVAERNARAMREIVQHRIQNPHRPVLELVRASGQSMRELDLALSTLDAKRLVEYSTPARGKPGTALDTEQANQLLDEFMQVNRVIARDAVVEALTQEKKAPAPKVPKEERIAPPPKRTAGSAIMARPPQRATAQDAGPSGSTAPVPASVLAPPPPSGPARTTLPPLPPPAPVDLTLDSDSSTSDSDADFEML